MDIQDKETEEKNTGEVLQDADTDTYAEASDYTGANDNTAQAADTEQPNDGHPVENGSNAGTSSKSSTPLIIMTVAILVMVCFTAVYCIVSDILGSDLNRETGSFQLRLYERPEAVSVYADENGKFTLEGLAGYMRPKIVKVLTYEKANDSKPKVSGSGIVISEDGYIVTNTHVINNMARYEVCFYDDKIYKAELKGKDTRTDIAVLKIEASGLEPARFGSSDSIVQGETVAAIGSPEGLSGSITSGIVSGLNRMIKSSQTSFAMNCIQTDAAISPGNSGGALVNMYGQVIGITSSKYTTSASEGLGFAITSNDAKPIIEELITKGYVSGRVRIGIAVVSDYMGYDELKFKDKYGFEMPDALKDSLWIEDVSKDCDISNTKLKSGDFIVTLNGKKVRVYDDIAGAIEGKKGGDKILAKCARVNERAEVEYFEIEFKLMADTSGDF